MVRSATNNDLDSRPKHVGVKIMAAPPCQINIELLRKGEERVCHLQHAP